MKKVVVAAAVVICCLLSSVQISNAQAVFTTRWDVSGLTDGEGLNVKGLYLDVQFGRSFMQVYGIADVEIAGPPVYGSGYILPDNSVIIYLSLSQYLLMLIIDADTGTGDVYLYGSTGKEVGSGTIALAGYSD